MEKTSGFKKFLKSKNVTLILVLIVVLVVCQIANHDYLSADNIRNILYGMSLAGTLVVGIGCILISGNCDLSAGGVGCMGGIVVALLLQGGWPWVPAMIVGLLFGAAAGLLNALFAYGCGMMPFISTLAMSSVWKGAAYIITDTYNIVISNEAYWKIGSIRLFNIIPLPFIISVILMVIYGIILARTSFGRNVYMIGGNRQAARLAGISVPKIGTILMINCSALASFGGMILASRMHNASPGSVHGTELEAITAAVLGGVAFGGGSGSMSGCFFGLLLLYAFNNGLTFLGLNAFWTIFSGGAILVVALMIDHFSTVAREKRLKVR